MRQSKATDEQEELERRRRIHEETNDFEAPLKKAVRPRIKKDDPEHIENEYAAPT